MLSLHPGSLATGLMMTPSISEDHEEIGGLDDITTLLTILTTIHEDVGLDDDHQHTGVLTVMRMPAIALMTTTVLSRLSNDDNDPEDLDNHGNHNDLTIPPFSRPLMTITILPRDWTLTMELPMVLTMITMFLRVLMKVTTVPMDLMTTTKDHDGLDDTHASWRGRNGTLVTS